MSSSDEEEDIDYPDNHDLIDGSMESFEVMEIDETDEEDDDEPRMLVRVDGLGYY
jgi:hypothetical protein